MSPPVLELDAVDALSSRPTQGPIFSNEMSTLADHIEFLTLQDPGLRHSGQTEQITSKVQKPCPTVSTCTGYVSGLIENQSVDVTQDRSSNVRYSMLETISTPTLCPENQDESEVIKKCENSGYDESYPNRDQILLGSWSGNDSEESIHPVESSRSSEIVQKSDVTSSQDNVTLASIKPSATLQRDIRWFPWSLASTYLGILGAISIVLGISCLVLTLLSNKHQGLRDANDTFGFQFSWRFLPTIVVVIYTLLWIPVMIDVLRTEPWALLSLLEPSKASDTLLKATGFWGFELARALKKKRPGGVRWPVIIAVMSGMVGPIILSPLSAGVFDLLDVTRIEKRWFETIGPIEHLPAMNITDTTYLKAITNFNLDVSTSVWIQRNFVIKPFWPIGTSNDPLDQGNQGIQQIWSGKTDVFKLQMECTGHLNVSVVERPKSLLGPGSPVISNDQGYIGKLLLTSEDGCSNVWELTSLERMYFDSERGKPGILMWNKTSSDYRMCKYDELIAMYNPSQDKTNWEFQPESYKAYVCTTTYATAYVDVNITSSPVKAFASIDTAAFDTTKQEVSPSLVTGINFKHAFLNEIGSKYFMPYDSRTVPVLGGPAFPLAAYFNFSINEMMRAPNFIQQAEIMKQAFFGQVLLSAFEELKQNSSNTVKILVPTSLKNIRLVVISWIGLTISVVMIFLGTLIPILIYLAGQKQRPLNLKYDPATSLAAVTMIQSTGNKLLELHGHQLFRLQDGRLIHENEAVTDNAYQRVPQNSAKPRINWSSIITRGLPVPTSGPVTSGENWLPFYLRRWSGALAFLVLGSLALSIGLIFRKGQISGLNQPIWLYEHNVTFGTQVTPIAPLSIIPASIAVGIKLWWGLADSAFRRVSPFMIMVKTLKAPSHGLALTYVNAPVLLVTFKAIRNKDFLLALVTFGALCTEILQVTMSALWIKEPQDITQTIELHQEYEIRKTPHIHSRLVTWNNYYGDGNRFTDIAENLNPTKNIFSNWLIQAFARTAFRAAPHPWTRDEWVFPPYDLRSISRADIFDHSSPSSSTQTIQSGLAKNITMNSSAISGTVECTMADQSVLDQYIIQHDNLGDSSQWVQLVPGPQFATGFELTNKVRIRYHDLLERASTQKDKFIGQWLPFGFQDGESDFDTPVAKNFTVLWIHVGPYQTFHAYKDIKNISRENNDRPQDIFNGVKPRWIFKDRPKIQALECAPIFQSSDARITINVKSEQIMHSKLLSKPRAIPEAWSDPFIPHYTTEEAYEHNLTISWGYLFQMGLLSAEKNSPTKSEVDPSDKGPLTALRIRDVDLSTDIMSYTALALADYNPMSLLDGEKLKTLSQRVFSKFFLSFASVRNPYLGYLAYQPINITTPFGLDLFGEHATVTITGTPSKVLSEIPVSCSPDVLSNFGSTTISHHFSCPPKAYTVIATSPGVPTVLVANPSAMISGPWNPPNHIVSAGILRIDQTSVEWLPPVTGFGAPTAVSIFTQASTPTAWNKVAATISVSHQVLIMSPIATYLSIGILVCLCFITGFVFFLQHHHLRRLPRDVDTPASILGFVSESEKLQAWVEEQEKLDTLRERIKPTSLWPWSKKAEKPEGTESENVLVGMGYFLGSDGKERWGVEIDASKEPLASP